eukprot:TRINITY_DN5206_c0_g1_i1.p1 TRINITY_DN5206_c0_g1~~TRINITY_DN5206_c0_g1_i1.p1  ORF type:complete len:206 (+),score=48.81 TRINITY_DN5206_c0_g1_i1:162-779(+)
MKVLIVALLVTIALGIERVNLKENFVHRFLTGLNYGCAKEGGLSGYFTVTKIPQEYLNLTQVVAGINKLSSTDKNERTAGVQLLHDIFKSLQTKAAAVISKEPVFQSVLNKTVHVLVSPQQLFEKAERSKDGYVQLLNKLLEAANESLFFSCGNQFGNFIYYASKTGNATHPEFPFQKAATKTKKKDSFPRGNKDKKQPKTDASE